MAVNKVTVYQCMPPACPNHKHMTLSTYVGVMMPFLQCNSCTNIILFAIQYIDLGQMRMGDMDGAIPIEIGAFAQKPVQLHHGSKNVQIVPLLQSLKHSLILRRYS